MSVLRRICGSIWAIILAAASNTALAAYPDRPIIIVVPFPAGSSADANVRVLAEELKAVLNTPIIVDNRAGATGIIGANAVARAAPDGYTLLYHTTTLVINAWLNKEAPDPKKAFVPIAQVASTPYVIAVAATSQIRNLAEFIAYARSRPGAMACSTYGIGSPPHLVLELLKRNASINVLHIPYRSFSQAFVDLSSGQLECAVDLPANVMQHVKSGKLIAIAATAPSDLSSVRDVPLLGSDYPDVNVLGWSGFFAPADTPTDVVSRIERAVHQSIRKPTVLKNLDAVGMSPSVEVTRVDFAKVIESDYVKFGEIIQRNGIRR